MVSGGSWTPEANCMWEQKLTQSQGGATVAQIAEKLMLAIIENCQNTQFITVCCVWVLLVACPMLKAPTLGMWASELDHAAWEEYGLV